MGITRNTRLKLIIFLSMLITLAVSIGTVYAETQYVSDQLLITLREGKGKEYKIITMLKADTPLEILEESEPYLKVRTQSGIEGWVLKQYITKETPKTRIIAGLEKKIGQLNAKIEQYENDRAPLQDELKATKINYNSKIRDLQQTISESRGKEEQTSKELNAITKKYNDLMKDSKDVVLLAKERDEIRATNSELRTRTDKLQKENYELKKSQAIWWFVAGAGVFFIGWIIGKISRQKRRY